LKGLSINRAAAKIDVSQQTLDSIVRGQTARCYASLRDRLAKLVGLPAIWLGGETDLLPSLTSWSPPPELGYTPPLWVDDNIRIMRPTGEGDYKQRTTLPPRYQLAAFDVAKRITDAWKRDIDRGDTEAKRASARMTKGRWKEKPWDRVAMVVSRLVSAFWWRRLFLKPAALPQVDPRRMTDAELESLSKKFLADARRADAERLASEDEFASTAAASLGKVFQPWFDGERAVDYAALTDVLEWASAGFGKDPSKGGT
jgi:hypothetical protein